MLDARRMEVYTAVFDRKQNWINNTNALVLNSESFLDQLGDASCLIIGNGAEKFKSLTPKINAHFTKEVHYPSAVNMIQLAWKKYTEKDFVALAKFEPFYLKDFQTTAPKK
jgi:tRNA threonylcarbamoyladenosine biosynthesis protein TsaB